MSAAATSIKGNAQSFFDACESGKGWDACKRYCHPGATFSAQTSALAGVETLEAYVEWLKGIYVLMPDAGYEILSFGVDEARNNATGFGIFRGTHTADGGPVPPTNKSVESEYVYIMQFEGDKISHMTKVWNDAISMQQLGWG